MRFNVIIKTSLIPKITKDCRSNTGWNVLLLILSLALSGAAWAGEDPDRPEASETAVSPTLPEVPAREATKPVNEEKSGGVQWKPLLTQSFRFLIFEQAYRYATEPATRHPGRPFFQGYIDSVGALHGWADGDPFYVNYVGHSMQGAVSGYLWTLNDKRYRYVEFGRNAEYWKSRMRAGAFAWAYSVQSEIGPISEASIGNIQASFPQSGFVDHVVTPAIGLGWMIAEDALDKYLVRLVERHTQNRTIRILVRGGANPSRSFANVFAGRWPWARPRDDFRGVSAFEPNKPPRKVQEYERSPGVPPFEFSANAYVFSASSGTCAGGGASAAFRISREWQMVLDVNGCKMTGLEENLTGDSLTYMAGPRWTPRLSSRLFPYLQALVGGNKLTQELMFPDQETTLVRAALANGTAPPDHCQYTRQFEVDGFALAAGGGLGFRFNRALTMRIAELEYTRSWIKGLPGFSAPNGLQFSTGIVLSMGTW